jgi:DNA 3'-phosphatase
MSKTVTEVVSGKLKHSKSAGFDMDDTLIYGSDGGGYKAYPFAVEKLRELDRQGYNILVFSNQKRPRQNDRIVNAKIEAVIELYDPLPIHFYCARGEDEFRKPGIGMLKLVPAGYGKLEFFVGDADGGEDAFSDADVGFAKGAGVRYETPEKYFNVYEEIGGKLPVELRESKIKFMTMVLLVGYPGCGKTTFCEGRLGHMKRISRDVVGNMGRCLKMCREELERGGSVVVDNLNASRESREGFIEVGNECGAAIVGVHFRVGMGVAQKRNEKRDGKGKVPSVVFYKYRKEFEMPMKDEGFDAIYSVI